MYNVQAVLAGCWTMQEGQTDVAKTIEQVATILDSLSQRNESVTDLITVYFSKRLFIEITGGFWLTYFIIMALNEITSEEKVNI